MEDDFPEPDEFEDMLSGGPTASSFAMQAEAGTDSLEEEAEDIDSFVIPSFGDMDDSDEFEAMMHQGAEPADPALSMESADDIADILSQEPPAPIPTMFSTKEVSGDESRHGAKYWIGIAVAVIAAIVVLLYVFRDTLVSTWPGLDRVYGAVGLHSTLGAGLDLKNSSAERVGDGANQTLVVRGQVINQTGSIVNVPPLRLAIYRDSTMVQQTISDPPQPLLQGHTVSEFTISMARPDTNANRLEVTFMPFGTKATPTSDPTPSPATPPAISSGAPTAGVAPAASTPVVGIGSGKAPAPMLTPPPAPPVGSPKL